MTHSKIFQTLSLSSWWRYWLNSRRWIAGLISSISLLGHLLATVARDLDITLILARAMIVHNLDKKLNNVGQDIVEIAKEFFGLLNNIINTIFYGVMTA